MSNKKEKKMKKQRKGTYIGAKLVLLVAFLVIISLGTLTFLVYYFVGAEVQKTAEKNNHTITTQLASAAEIELDSIRANTFLMLDILEASSFSEELYHQTSDFFFDRNQNIVSVIIPEKETLINNRLFISNEIEIELIADFLTQRKDEIARTENGESFLFNAAPVFKCPVLALFLPWRESGQNQAAIILFSSDSLTAAFGTDSQNLSFMINHDGELLIHQDYNLIEAGASMAKLQIVEQMRKNNDENNQISFTDSDGKEYLGSYSKLSVADAGVLTIIEKNVALKTVTNQTRQNIYVSLAFFFLIILIIWLFSKHINKSIQKNISVAEEQKSLGSSTPDLGGVNLDAEKD